MGIFLSACLTIQVISPKDEKLCLRPIFLCCFQYFLFMSTHLWTIIFSLANFLQNTLTWKMTVQIPHVEEFQMTSAATLPSRRGNVTPHSITAGCAQWLPSKEHRMENITEELYSEETWQTTSSWWSRSLIMLIVCSLDKMWWKWHFTSVVFFPTHPYNPSLITR